MTYGEWRERKIRGKDSRGSGLVLWGFGLVSWPWLKLVGRSLALGGRGSAPSGPLDVGLVGCGSALDGREWAWIGPG